MLLLMWEFVLGYSLTKILRKAFLTHTNQILDIAFESGGIDADVNI